MTERTPTFKTKIAGLSFRPRGIKAEVASLKEGDAVDLVRDPSNTNDPNAIKIMATNGTWLGYVSREVAAQLAPMMDNEATRAVIDTPQIHMEPPIVKIEVLVF